VENGAIYRIQTIAHGAVHSGEVFSLPYNRPEGAKAPETQGQLVYLPCEGLELSMWCREENPRSVYHQPNDPVHTDSCVEMFLNCFPDSPEYGYIGLEINANGASHCSFGTSRHMRAYVLNLGLPHPAVRAECFIEHGQSWWRVSCLLRQSLLEALYERDCAFEPGHRMRGNFYKCGDDTESPHWASWAPLERVDFHVPELFGEFVIQSNQKCWQT
jgi:hypothetical protein